MTTPALSCKERSMPKAKPRRYSHFGANPAKSLPISFFSGLLTSTLPRITCIHEWLAAVDLDYATNNPFLNLLHWPLKLISSSPALIYSSSFGLLYLYYCWTFFSQHVCLTLPPSEQSDRTLSPAASIAPCSDRQNTRHQLSTSG